VVTQLPRIFVVTEETILTDIAIAYTVPRSFDETLQSVRRALVDGGLEVIADLDLSSYVDRALGVDMPACIVLCVWSRGQLEEELLTEATLPGMLPFHVVISARGNHTTIHIPGSLPRGVLSPLVQAPVTAIQACLARTLDRIAMRQCS
jgi:uncharacterized protein (DUF302 family)